MDLLTIFCAFLFCLYEVLGEFVIKSHAGPEDPNNQVDNPMQIIRYSIKVPKDFPDKYGPVFYGVSGRETLEEMMERFTFFEQTSPQFNNAAIVFAEARYFGNSTLTNDPINDVDDLQGLTMKGTINDNILLIKKLSEILRTYNFLVFGVGHGGLLAGYISFEFFTNPSLSKFKVLPWAASSTLKYLRLETKSHFTVDYQEINKKFAELLIEAGCNSFVGYDFGIFFSKVHHLKLSSTIFKQLNLNPPIQDSENFDDQLREFVIFLRNGIKEMAFKNRKFDEHGIKININETLLKKLCDVMHNVPNDFDDHITTKDIEGVLLLINFDYKPLGQGKFSTWRINPRVENDLLNRKAALSAYQDCTNWQLMSCTNNEFLDDPFSYTNWDYFRDCTSLDDFDQNLFEECQGLFGPKLNSSEHRLNANEYYRNLKKNFIATMSKDSIYHDSYTSFTTNSSNFAWRVDMAGLDGLEFESAKECDSDHLLDVRYLILRAFGCFANIIDQSVCRENIFDDNINRKTYSDKPKSGNCAVNNLIEFPYGHAKINFLEVQGSSKKSGSVENNVNDGKSVETQTNSPQNSANSLGKVIVVLCVIYFVHIIL